jgi:hypothetical protein
MKALIDIKDSKVSFVMELLNSLNFVKVKPLTKEKAEQVMDIKEAIDELNLIKEGKLKGIPAKDLLNEL